MFVIGKNRVAQFIILNLAFYIVVFQINNVNYLWLFNNLILNLFLLSNIKNLAKKVLTLLIIVLFLLLFYFLYSEIKHSSFFLTLFLTFSAAIQISFCINNLAREDFANALSVVFFIFLGAYIIQCICVFGHLPIFNGFGLTKENTSIFRLNAFSPEPSMASQLIILLMYLFNLNNTILRKNQYVFELLALILMVIFGSVFGYISLLAYVFVVHRKSFPKLFSLELLSGALIVIYFLSASETLTRISNLIIFIWAEFDIVKLASIEPSGSFRFYPLVHYFQMFDSNNFHFFFGFGPGASTTFFNEGLISDGFGLDLDSNFQGGFIPSFFVDYGIIITIILIYFIYSNCIIKHNIFEYSFAFLLLLNTNINTQLFWFYIFSTFLAKKYYSHDMENLNKLVV
jgi:hypothetical protein